jgi:predicted  nucleic acid-binding Zn-ribbon protein
VDLDELAEEKRSTPKYVQLAPARKRIPQELIDGWPEASPQLLEGISTVLREAKRTIALSRGDERKIKEAEDGLNALIRALERKLTTVKIPPMAKDFQFNVDKLTERNTTLAAEVTTARHTNQLLEEQKQVAQHLLKKDEDNLEKLKKDVKEWRKEWKYQQKRVQVHNPPILSTRIFRLPAECLLTYSSSILCCKTPKKRKSKLMDLRILV